jgi:hypothetical protein
VDTPQVSDVSVRFGLSSEADRMTIQRASLVAVFLVAAGAAPVAHLHAATTVLGATVCVRADTVGATGNGLQYVSDGVHNISGAPADVVCTLFRDNTSNTNGMQDLEVSVFDPTAAPGSTSCIAVSAKRNGDPLKTVTKRSATTGNQIIDFGGALNASVSKGHYSVRCTIPNDGVIHNIFYLEP